MVAAVLVITTCSVASVPSSPPVDLPEHLPEGTDGLASVLHTELDVRMVPGNRVELIENGRIFDELVRGIDAARSSVHVEIFIWRKSEPSDRVVEALRARRPGVECRVVVDPAGSIDFDDEVQGPLEKAGCEVRIFRPFTQVWPGEYLERNHRKLVVIDGQVALTGGWGIWRSWLGEGRKTEEWRDSNVRVEGPVVAHFQAAFGRTWQAVGGGKLPRSAFPALSEQGTASAGFVISTAPERGQASEAEKAIRLLIASATKRLWISNSYFVPSDELVALLAAKRRAGVDVRILAPGPVHDWPSIRAAQRATYEPLLEAGVRIWEYQPSMMHAKTILVDDRLVMVGSTNLDWLSLRQMEENAVLVDDPVLAGQLARSFLEDLEYSEEFSQRTTAVLERVSRRFFWLIGRFL